MTAILDNDEVSLQVREAVATIIVERPHKRNAMGLAAWRALRSLVVAAEGNPAVGLIVVRGAGKHFGAGNDISEISSLPGSPVAARAFATAMADAMQSVEDASKPVIMAIEGVCYGAALALALAGDLRIAAANAAFCIPAAKLGALYLRSDLQRLVATIGVGQSKKIVFSAETIWAKQARHMGLVDEVFAEDRFESELQRLVETILSGSPSTLLRTKEMLRGLGHGASPRETSESLSLWVESTQSTDFAEGTSAFLTRRTPRFRRNAAC
jgi:enoyl-CoA hydratase/carnithine racemase